jgi:hypothetical protein
VKMTTVRAILESHAGRTQGHSTSDFSTDLIGQRNSIAHGGDVRTDVEVSERSFSYVGELLLLNFISNC